MNFVYFIWTTKQGHHQDINITIRELCVSILSIEKHMSGSKIFVYMSIKDKINFECIRSFVENHNVNIVFVDEQDLHGSYFNKILWFRKAIDDMGSFVFMDTDATFIKTMPPLINVPLCFSRFIKDRTKKFTKVQMGFIKKYFNIRENYRYFRSTVVWVDQNAISKFPWKNFRTALDEIICIFKERIEKEVPHIGKNRKQFYMDELFFSTAIHNIGLKPENYNTPNLKDYNQYILPDWGIGLNNKGFIKIYNSAKTIPEIKKFFV